MVPGAWAAEICRGQVLDRPPEQRSSFVGSVRNALALRWGLAGHIVTAWIVTIPATALIAAVFYGLSTWLF